MIRFSLRTLLIVVTMAACFCAGWKAHEVASRRRALIRGVVLGMNGNVYELSLGADDGVKAGSVLSVLNGKTRVGEIVAIRTEPDRCFGVQKQATFWPLRFEMFGSHSAKRVINKGDSVTFPFPTPKSADSAQAGDVILYDHPGTSFQIANP